MLIPSKCGLTAKNRGGCHGKQNRNLYKENERDRYLPVHQSGRTGKKSDRYRNSFLRSYAGRIRPPWSVRPDLEVDSHHTIEDTGIVLGQAIAKALGDKAGIKRYGYFILPMDEVLALSAVDLSGRPYLKYDADFTVPVLGSMDTEMVREFFYAVSYSAAMNLHLKIMEPGNNHHMAEALFKAFGKALDMAVSEEPRIKEVWSTKGSL